jgi:outer membrane protein TolC
MSKLTAIMFPVAFVVSAAGYAQDAAPIRLTLNDAIARGLAASHRVAEGTARQDAADAVAGARHAATMPQVTALAGYTRTNHVQEFTIPLSPVQSGVLYPDAPDNYRARLDAQWPLYTGGRLDALAEAAQKDAAASAADVDALRTDLRFEITRAYWGLFLADESLRVFDESLERARRQAVDAQNQLDAGLVPPSDVLSARAQESRQQMLRIQAGTTRVSAEAELARLVGLPPGTAIQPDGSVAQDQVAAPYSALLARALDQRQDRRALVVRLAGAESREKAAAAGRTPTRIRPCMTSCARRSFRARNAGEIHGTLASTSAGRCSTAGRRRRMKPKPRRRSARFRRASTSSTRWSRATSGAAWPSVMPAAPQSTPPRPDSQPRPKPIACSATGSAPASRRSPIS